MDGIRKLLDAGVSQVTNFQLMLLKGSELETAESRQLFQYQSMFRLLPKNFGVYGGEKVMDVEEIVVATDTLDFEDYIKARKHALGSVAFWHDDTFLEVVKYAEKCGVKRSDWLFSIVPAMESDQGAVKNFLNSFEGETRGELFPTKEACLDFYSQEENWEKLMNSEIGDNLMHKYQAIASFHIWPEICKLAMDVTREQIEIRGAHREIPHFDEFWRDLHTFVLHQHAHGVERDEILAPTQATMRFDIDRWIEDGMPLDPSPYRLAEATTFEFALTEEAFEGLSSALNTWQTHIKGLTKMMKRIRVIWLVKTCRTVNPSVMIPPATTQLLAVSGD
jgi:hypothetical protein